MNMVFLINVLEQF